MRMTTTENQRTGPAHIARRGKVLIVDDDPKDLRSLSLTLQQQGHDVRACASYLEALRHMESEVFDFVVVNQGSHEFEGRSVLVRAIEIDRHTPVVVLTRSVDMGCYMEAMQLGALDYLEKPIATADLVWQARNHLRPPDSRA
jgi:two-component system KDP operon response regulator KdpE